MSETTTLTVIDAESTAITVVSGDGEDTITVIGGEEAPVTVIGTVPNGPPGADGVDGEGVPTGGALGQVLTKQSGTDFDTDWEDPTGGSGAVDSVDGQTGVVVLSGVYQPLDSDLTAIAALSTTAFGRSLLALADAAAGRTALGLGTVATHAHSEYDLAGAAAAAQAASQPLDSDLTAIAALTTTSYGRAFLALADAAAGRTALGLGTAATSASSDFQPIDSDLTAIAALTTTSFGRGLLALADAAAVRSAIGLTAATVPFVPNGSISSTDVQAAIQEVRDEAGSGSGLPDPWTADQTSGEVTATVAGALDITALEILADEGQEVAPLVITSDTELGSTDLLRIRQSVAKGDSDLFTVDDSGEVDITLVDPAATALNVQEAQDGESRLVNISGSMANRVGISELIRIAVQDLAGGESTQTLFDGGLRFNLGSFGEVLAFDPVEGTTTITAHTGQTEQLLVVNDENGDPLCTISPAGEVVLQTNDITKTALVIRALAGQDFTHQVRIEDERGHEMWSVAQEDGAIGATHHFGLRNSSDTLWDGLFRVQIDSNSAPEYTEAFFGLGNSVIGNAITFDTFWSGDVSSDSYTKLLLHRHDEQTVPIVTIRDQVGSLRLFVVGKDGAIGTRAGEPADADILPGECFRFFDSTDGAARIGYKAKTDDGTVVYAYGPMGP